MKYKYFSLIRLATLTKRCDLITSHYNLDPASFILVGKNDHDAIKNFLNP